MKISKSLYTCYGQLHYPCLIKAMYQSSAVRYVSVEGPITEKDLSLIYS